MGQLLAYGAYDPHYRLGQTTIAAALQAGGGRMPGGGLVRRGQHLDGGQAARQAAGGAISARSATYLATTSPAYLDKTNPCLVMRRSGWTPPPSPWMWRRRFAAARAADRGARRAAPDLAVLFDLRGGLPGSADERDGGDAAAAFLFGAGSGIAEVDRGQLGQR